MVRNEHIKLFKKLLSPISYRESRSKRQIIVRSGTKRPLRRGVTFKVIRSRTYKPYINKYIWW